MPIQFPILVIDDEPAIADVLNRVAKITFPEASFTHLSDFNGAIKYLEHMGGRPPKLILMDIDLHTGKDGLELLNLLRRHPSGRLLPVVMLSSHSHSAKLKRAYEYGASSFISKPYSYQQWKDLVSQLRQYWFQTVTIPTLWLEDGIDL
jgi:CheY-like chemotaxis protein